MDNHPIPQDITGFQFKLIGKMTIRQFIYVAIGAIIAWFVFFILEPPFIIRWPVSLISLGLGLLIAFVPVDGRPMDTMLKNFVNALRSPTQFIYQKEMPSAPASNISSFTPVPEARNNSATPPPAQVQPEMAQTQPVTIPNPPAPPPVTFNDPTSMPSNFVKKLNEEQPNEKPQIIDEKDELKKKIEELQKQLQEKSNQETTQSTPQVIQEAPTPQTQQASPQDQKELEKMLSESVRQKEALEKQIIEMQNKQASSDKQKYTPITATQQQTTHRVRKVPADMASSVGIPSAPEAPNLITGIIKDSRGNPISNILVEIKDLDGNPVRAFKTNKLGKFASATSLSNGKYVISFEDPGEKHKFDDIEMELIGASVMPLEVISVDPREELRRELFN